MEGAAGETATAVLWSLQIPVRISLYANEISTPVDLKPIYMLAPRQSYFPKVAADALRFFQHALASIPGQSALQPWLDYRGLPLKWNLPVGVLYDLLVASGDLPWDLTVHLHGSPEAAVALDGANTMRGLFFNSLKEAAYISRGSEGASAVMQMSSAAQDDLWAAAESGDLPAYRTALAAVRLTPVQRGNAGPGPSIPIRLLVRMTSDTGFLSTWEHTVYTSRPADAHQPGSTTPQLLSEVLHHIKPQLFPLPPPPQASTAEDDSASQGAGAGGTTAGGAAGGAGGAAAGGKLVVKVNGVDVPLDSPLAWLHANFHAPDFFLYIVAYWV